VTSQKQIEANRRNAKKSTGPRTPEGKARSSRNAITHGFYSRDLVIPGEFPESFEALHEGFRESFLPTDAIEESLVLQMAIAQWRIYRLVRSESAHLWRRINSGSEADDLEYSEARDLFPPADGRELANYRLGKAFGEITGASDRFTQVSRFETSLRRSFYQAFQAIEARRQLHRVVPASGGPKTKNDETNPFAVSLRRAS
jgi:hypothetical protein